MKYFVKYAIKIIDFDALTSRYTIWVEGSLRGHNWMFPPPHKS